MIIPTSDKYVSFYRCIYFIWYYVKKTMKKKCINIYLILHNNGFKIRYKEKKYK